MNEECEQLRVQLAGCGVAALGGTPKEQVAKIGDFGWSPAYQDVLDLRIKYNALQAKIQKLEEEPKIYSVTAFAKFRDERNALRAQLDAMEYIASETENVGSNLMEQQVKELQAKLDRMKEKLHRLSTYDCGFIANNIIAEAIKELND